MCGIAGLVTSEPVPGTTLAAMRDALGHRGPDDRGLAAWRRNPAGAWQACADDGPAHVQVAHTRLAILDLSPAGHQPMRDPSTGTTLVYNGEVYNYRELRDQLVSKGHRFASSSDSEVVLAAWREWGTAMFPRLVGMFALAIVDPDAGRLVLARDFAGIKPLFVARRQGRLAFASEIKALLADPTQERRAEPAAIWHYLAAGLTDHLPTTCFAGIERFPPGSYAIVDLTRPEAGWQTTAFWQPVIRPVRDIPFAQAAREVRDCFLDSVRLHLRSDVPVGAALSGGIDSSAVVCAMRMIEPGLDLHTFSYVADDPAVNEERWADLVVAHTGAQHHRVRIRAEELRDGIDDLIRQQDEPFGSTSIFAQRRVFEAARASGIRVMLDGQGADEILAGYSMHLPARLADCLRAGRLGEAARLAVAIRRRHPGLPMLTGTAAQLAGGGSAERLRGWRWRRRTGRGVVQEWFRTRCGWPPPPAQHGGPPLVRDLRRSFTVTLPTLLRYEDRNAMACSIESRVPFLTPAMVDLAWSLPAGHLVARDATGKSVFRAAMRGIVPDAILDRRDKISFATPELAWLRGLGDWPEQILCGPAAHAIPCLDAAGMLAEWRAVREGAVAFDWRVWRWINLVRWSELHGVRWD